MFPAAESWNGKYSSICSAAAYFSLFTNSFLYGLYVSARLLAPSFFCIILRMMTTFMDFWLCSGLTTPILNRNTDCRTEQ